MVSCVSGGSSNNHLLTALLEHHPIAVLDAMFAGEPDEQAVGSSIFERLSDHQSNAADVIPCEPLTAWCEQDHENRYPLAASIITYAQATSSSLAWSEQAKVLLSNAPDPRRVLEVFIERFQPMSWSGSRAAIIELCAHLLDSVEPLVPASLMPFVTEAKAQLVQIVAREREWETRQDRARDERFE